MSYSLAFADQLILLSLNDDKGNFDTSGIYLSYSLIGSGITELLLNGNIRIENERLKCISNTDITHPFLSKLFTDLQDKWEGKKSKSILQNLARQYTSYQKITLDHLISLGIIEEVNKKILWVFNSKRYPEKNSLPENLLRAHLQRVIKQIDPMTERDICIFKFLKTSGLIKQFKPENVKTRAFLKEIDQLIEQAPISSSFKAFLKEIDDSIIAAIVMITVVT